MNTIISDFENKVAEIEAYFGLIDAFINKNAQLFFPTNMTRKNRKINDDLVKVLKANCFLLLYNLIESSIKVSISKIYESVSSKNKKYCEISDNIRKIWILEKHDNFKNKSTEEIFGIIENIAENIIQIGFDSRKKIAGNIDASKIREFSDGIGFSVKSHYRSGNGEKLFIVKNRRNDLAHGNKSFSECGREYTYEDLVAIKSESIIYIRGILKNIKKFIDEEKFCSD